MNIPAGRHAQPSLQSGREIGDDVPEHVVGDDHVELARVAHHLHAERVDVHVLRGNFWKLRAHFFENALPQPTGVGHGIGFVAHQNFTARGAVELRMICAVLKCIADDALHAFARIDILLRGDLVGSSLLEYAASVGINAFGIFAKHDKVHILGLDSFQWAQRRVKQSHRTHVGIEIHLEAHAEQNFFGMNVGLDPRITKSPYEDRIEVAGQHGEAIGRNGCAIAQIAVRSPIEVSEFDRSARGLNHAHSQRDDFLADAVSRDDGDALFCAFFFCTFFFCAILYVHGRKGNTIAIIKSRAMGPTALQIQSESLHKNLGAGFSQYKIAEYRGAMTAARFNDPQREWTELRSGCGIYDLGYRARISLGGSDRVRWLNGMVTNNIRDLAADVGIYAFLLNPQGHILGDLYAYNRGEAIVADTDRSQLEKILATFDHYIIMDDVEVTNLSEQLTALGVAGPKARQILQQAGIAVSALQPLQINDATCECACDCVKCTVVRGDDPTMESYELWLSPADVKETWDALLAAGATPVGFEALELQRIVSGIPLYGVDIRERDLPQETEQARALNFNKGCYVGQEIVERIRSRGAVHRKFSGFVVERSAQIASGAKVIAGEKEVGEITSAASLRLEDGEKTVALGYLRREVSLPGREVAIGNVKANVVPLPIDLEALSQPERLLQQHPA
jgi:folate-binding protein YgfZ